MAALAALLAACGPQADVATDPPGDTPADSVLIVPDSPSAGDLRFVRPYQGSDDLCYLVGETPSVADLLDDTADLVACPLGDAGAEALVAQGGRNVAQIGAYTLYSVPRR
jgi:hypothetical protein